MDNTRKLLKDGDEVAHYLNLKQKMIVTRIIKRHKGEPTGKMAGDKPIYETMTIVLGIECHWWENTKEGKVFRKHRFHSRELMLWNKAQKIQQEYESKEVTSTK